MASTSLALHPAIERYQIHLAVCRARRAGLVCSTCCEFAERADRALAAMRQIEQAA